MSKYVLIPDSFKGTLSSLEVCRIVAEEIRAQEPDAEICAIPVADGGGAGGRQRDGHRGGV